MVPWWSRGVPVVYPWCTGWCMPVGVPWGVRVPGTPCPVHAPCRHRLWCTPVRTPARRSRGARMANCGKWGPFPGPKMSENNINSTFLDPAFYLALAQINGQKPDFSDFLRKSPKIVIFGPILTLFGPPFWTHLPYPHGTFPRCPVLVAIWAGLKIEAKIVHLGCQKTVIF